MPVLNTPASTAKKKAVTIRMPEDLIATLHRYARFLGSSLDHVVIEALKLVFKKDSEFKAWQAEWQHCRFALPNQKRDGHRATGEEKRESISRSPSARAAVASAVRGLEKESGRADA